MGPPSNTKVTAGRSVDMAQSKKSFLCLGISCGIMASQATRITAFDIWGLKFEEKNMKNILFNLRVTAGK